MWTRLIVLFLLLITLNTSVFAGGKKKKKCTKQSARDIEHMAKQVDEIHTGDFSKPLRDQLLYIVKDRKKLIPREALDRFIVATRFQTKDFVSSKNLEVHFKKHKDEFGLTDQDSYLNKAKKFSRSGSEEVISLQAKDGTWGKLNPKTGEYIAVTPEGTSVVTYYMADLKFKNELVRKYNESIRGKGLPNKKQYVSLVDWFMDRSLNGPLDINFD